MIHVSCRRKRLFLLAGFLVPGVVGFMCVPSFLVGKGLTSKLFTSLSAPPRDAQIQDDSDDDIRKKKTTIKKSGGKKTQKKETPACYKFRNHMTRLSKTLRGSLVCADVMDDELERMEVRWYGGEMRDPPRYVGDSIRLYKGPSVQPDPWCYAMVANAYVRSGQGVKGAQLTEEVLRRCESHLAHDKYADEPNTILRTAVMNAWAKADQWDRADAFLQEMEDIYDESGNEKDAPDTITFTVYLEALSASKVQKPSDMAKKSVELLERMHEMADTGENVFASPNSYTYTAAMKCQPSTTEGAEAAESLLRKLHELYNISGDPSLKPSALAYLAAIFAWTRSGGGLEAAQRAYELNEELLKLHKETGDKDYLPLEGHYTAILSAYSRVKPHERSQAVRRVDKLLEQIENDPHTKLSSLCYSAAMKVKAQTGNPIDATDSEKLFRRIQNPDIAMYQSVIKAHAGAGNAEEAEKLINEMENLTEGGTFERRADTVMYAACIHAWVKRFRRTRDVNAVEKADAMLRRIVSLHRDKLVRKREESVDGTVFARVIQLWAESRHPEAGERAEQIVSLLEEMRAMAPGGENLYAVSEYAYTYLLDAWATSARKDAATRALAILERMDADSAIETNCRAISSVLTSVSKSRLPDAGSIAENLLLRMLTLYVNGDRSSVPNVRTYTGILRRIIHSELRDADLRALKLFRHIRGIHDESRDDELAPNDITYGCVLNGLAKKGRVDETEKLFSEMKRRYADGHSEERPNLVTYSTVIDAYRNNASGNSPLRAAALLEELEEGYRQGDSGLKPDTQLFNSVIRALASGARKDPKAVEKAEQVLKRMELSESGDVVLKPDIISYSTVCLAYANSNITGAAEKADSILSRVESLSQVGAVTRPDMRIYSTVVLAYSKDKKVQSQLKAEALFNRTESLYKEGRSDLKPNSRIMNQMISGWARCHSKQKIQHAQAVLERMTSLYEAGNEEVRPNTVSYNWLMHAAALSKSNRDVIRLQHFQVALDTFKLVHSNDNDLRPSETTYLYFLKACKSLLRKGEVRNKLVTNLFTLATQNGLVCDGLFKQLKAFNPHVIEEALKSEGLEFHRSMMPTSLPKSWRRNLYR